MFKENGHQRYPQWERAGPRAPGGDSSPEGSRAILQNTFQCPPTGLPRPEENARPPKTPLGPWASASGRVPGGRMGTVRPSSEESCFSFIRWQWISLHQSCDVTSKKHLCSKFCCLRIEETWVKPHTLAASGELNPTPYTLNPTP